MRVSRINGKVNDNLNIAGIHMTYDNIRVRSKSNKINK